MTAPRGRAHTALAPVGPYWYENLEDRDFQRLCQTLLVHSFPGVRSYPVGQKDGGRDATRRLADGDVVYQVKWSKKAPADAVTWLARTVEDESDAIRALVRSGARKYVLLTNVEGTAAMAGADGKGGGTIDRLDARLDEMAKSLGLAEMDCWWRTDLDARVRLLPDSAIWPFFGMLAGQDALRFFTGAKEEALAGARLASVLRRVLGRQWTADERVKFKQAELDNDDLEDLFVDVHARVEGVVDGASSPGRSDDASHPGGAVAYLANSSYPLTLVRGEPGQGKSTLGQYLAQVFRSGLIPEGAAEVGRRPGLQPRHLRLPFRVDLRDYATWIEGQAPFAPDAPRTRGPRARADVERFLVELIGELAADTVDLALVHDMLDRFPILVVFDGLDEVARPDVRARIVTEIEAFVGRRWFDRDMRPKVVVTTRPNVADLAEPSPTKFETLTLLKLGPALSGLYLRKWCAARDVGEADRDSLVRTFDTKSAEPHIAQLAQNPMSLTILLYLLHRQGLSVPDRRTQLYDEYMKTFLNREADKSPSVQANRSALEEVTAFLGWLLQSRAETKGSSGRMTTVDLKTEIFRYLLNAGRDTSLVDVLFTDVTDRVWALTSKASGTWEFDVQPVREFFAAKYLAQYAGKDKASDILGGMLVRPFWLNTCRFFAGFANANELGGLVDGLADVIEAGRHPLLERTAILTLLADGVFSWRARAQTRAVGLLADDLGVRMLLVADGGNEPLPPLPSDRGGAVLVGRLLAAVEDDPRDPLSVERVRLAATLGPDREALRTWWADQAWPAFGGKTEEVWLRLGEPMEGGTALGWDASADLALAAPGASEAALAAGVSPAPGSSVENLMLAELLAGGLSDVPAPGTGLVADLANVLAPRNLLALAKGHGESVYATASGHCSTFVSDRHRQDAFNRLGDRDGSYKLVQASMAKARVSTGTVAPWSEAADHLREVHGPCWLAGEIAVIGASIPAGRRRDTGTMDPRRPAFGEDVGYGSLVNDTRRNHADAGWWLSQRQRLGQATDRAVWGLALLGVADPTVVSACLGALVEDARDAPKGLLDRLVGSSSRLGLSKVGRRLPADLVAEAAPRSLPVAVMLSHHADTLTSTSNLSAAFTAGQAAAAARFGASAWPVVRAAGTALSRSSDGEWLAVLATFGPGTVGTGATGPVEAGTREAIMGSPTDFPIQWLRMAEMSHSLETVEPPLADAATGWFAD